MKIQFQLISFVLVVLLNACNTSDRSSDGFESDYSRQKLDSLHSGFNTTELSKEQIHLDKDTITIVTFGHVYGLQYHEDIFDTLIEKVNAENPDYVWILGDIVFNNTNEEWDYLLDKYKRLQGRRYHAGGNHDMNYHYERYFGNKENQWEAEMRFLNYVGYRYKSIEDDVANYMMINMNDSLDRIKDYLTLMLPGLNPDKQSILFTHHSTWHNVQSKGEDPTTWVKKSFVRDSLLSEIKGFQYLVHGDWGGKYFYGDFNFEKHKFKVLGVGNLNEGDPLFISTIKITKDDLWAYPTYIEIADSSSWNK